MVCRVELYPASWLFARCQSVKAAKRAKAEELLEKNRLAGFLFLDSHAFTTYTTVQKFGSKVKCELRETAGSVLYSATTKIHIFNTICGLLKSFYIDFALLK